MKQFFKVLALQELRTFAIILARIMPLHVQTSTLPAYLTEEQARAEVRSYGLPENIIELMHWVDESEVDKEDVSDPWAHDEADDEQMVDVTPYDIAFGDKVALLTFVRSAGDTETFDLLCRPPHFNRHSRASQMSIVSALRGGRAAAGRSLSLTRSL
jgi:hypothetical protein